MINTKEIRELIHNPIPYEILTFEDGKQIKVRLINSVSDEARKNLNKKYYQLHKQGLA